MVDVVVGVVVDVVVVVVDFNIMVNDIMSNVDPAKLGIPRGTQLKKDALRVMVSQVKESEIKERELITQARKDLMFYCGKFTLAALVFAQREHLYDTIEEALGYFQVEEGDAASETLVKEMEEIAAQRGNRRVVVNPNEEKKNNGPNQNKKRRNRRKHKGK